MPGRMARTPQSSARVGHSLLGLQTRHCSHRWDRCEEPKDPGAAVKMRESLLRKLHRVHQGVDKSIQRARDKWFWPGMSELIRRLILTCPSCLEHQPRQKQAAVIPVITTDAKQILGCDIFQHAGRWYSCIVDYHTGYPWVKPIKNQESDTVIQHFQSVCKEFGYPTEIASERATSKNSV